MVYIELEPEMIIGLTILARIHGGSFEVTCGNCSEFQKNALGCLAPSDRPVFVDLELGEFYSCPVKWITPQIIEFYSEYSYYKDFPSAAPSWNDVGTRFLSAMQVYKRALNDAEMSKMDRQASKTSEKGTKSSLSSLRRTHDSKRVKTPA